MQETGARPFSDRTLLIWRVSVGLLLLASWEGLSTVYGERWISRPTMVGLRLAGWMQEEDLYFHLTTTLTEVIGGLAIGGTFGSLLGLLLGRSEVLSLILRPIIVGLYSVPLVTLAPVFILFFGLEMSPKIILVSLVVFFLLFFNTFSGAQSVDRDIVDSLKLMGANRIERLRKVIAPASMAWILAGFKVALPYSLVAAVTGEILSARSGIGLLLVRGYTRFDMAAVYAALLILICLGLLLSESFNRLERWLLRWRV
jgi:NitT/TauT family transport system permease protein